jgi:hypothetical protein
MTSRGQLSNATRNRVTGEIFSVNVDVKYKRL